jgi:hypothetical protein
LPAAAPARAQPPARAGAAGGAAASCLSLGEAIRAYVALPTQPSSAALGAPPRAHNAMTAAAAAAAAAELGVARLRARARADADGGGARLGAELSVWVAADLRAAWAAADEAAAVMAGGPGAAPATASAGQGSAATATTAAAAAAAAAAATAAVSSQLRGLEKVAAALGAALVESGLRVLAAAIAATPHEAAADADAVALAAARCAAFGRLCSVAGSPARVRVLAWELAVSRTSASRGSGGGDGTADASGPSGASGPPGPPLHFAHGLAVGWPAALSRAQAAELAFALGALGTARCLGLEAGADDAAAPAPPAAQLARLDSNPERAGDASVERLRVFNLERFRLQRLQALCGWERKPTPSGGADAVGAPALERVESVLARAAAALDASLCAEVGACAAEAGADGGSRQAAAATAGELSPRAFSLVRALQLVAAQVRSRHARPCAVTPPLMHARTHDRARAHTSVDTHAHAHAHALSHTHTHAHFPCFPLSTTARLERVRARCSPALCSPPPLAARLGSCRARCAHCCASWVCYDRSAACASCCGRVALVALTVVPLGSVTIGLLRARRAVRVARRAGKSLPSTRS